MRRLFLLLLFFFGAARDCSRRTNFSIEGGYDGFMLLAINNSKGCIQLALSVSSLDGRRMLRAQPIPETCFGAYNYMSTQANTFKMIYIVLECGSEDVTLVWNLNSNEKCKTLYSVPTCESGFAHHSGKGNDLSLYPYSNLVPDLLLTMIIQPGEKCLPDSLQDTARVHFRLTNPAAPPRRETVPFVLGAFCGILLFAVVVIWHTGVCGA
jgi:hypothetical protein